MGIKEPYKVLYCREIWQDVKPEWAHFINFDTKCIGDIVIVTKVTGVVNSDKLIVHRVVEPTPVYWDNRGFCFHRVFGSRLESCDLYDELIKCSGE